MNIYKTKKYVLAIDAPSYDAGALHVDMRLGKAPYCAELLLGHH